MRIFATLVWREIAERRLLLAAGLFLGLVPIVLPWLPGIPARFSPEEIRVAATIGLAALFGSATLLILGSTIVGRDLSEKRLGFYFSRPIKSWVLWLSRITAALALVLVSVTLIVTPTSIVDAGSWLETLWERDSGAAWPFLLQAESRGMPFNEGPMYSETPDTLPPALAAAFGGLTILLLLVLTHAVSSMVRGRNLWVLADLAGLAVVLGLVWNARDVLVREQALGALVWAERLLPLSILVALVVAGGVQLAGGRIDLLRGHRYLSATLWPSLIVITLAFGAYSRWVASSTIDDLEVLTRFHSAPGEQWLMVGGPVRHRAGARAAFLLEAVLPEGGQRNTAGRVALKERKPIEVRLGNLSAARAWLAFSPDGGTAVWARCEGTVESACELWAKDLRDAPSPPRPTGIPIHLTRMRWQPGSDDAALTFNQDGTLLAVAEEDRLVVYGVGPTAGAAPVVAAVDAKLPDAVVFLPGNQLRFHQHVSSSSDVWIEQGGWTEIRKLDLESRQVRVTGKLPTGYGGVRSPVRDSLFYRRHFPHGLGLYDGETGQALVELENIGGSISGWGRFLADGRLIVGHRSQHGPGRAGAELSLLILSPDGQELHRIERSGVWTTSLGGELSPGRLLFALSEKSPPNGQVAPHKLDVEPLPYWTTYVLDADSGELSPLVAGVRPLGRLGTSAERLFLAGCGKVVRWNPDTGESRTIFAIE